MKKIINTALLLILMGFGFAPKAYGAVYDSVQIAYLIKNDIVEQIKQQFEGKIEVEVTALPYQTVEVPNGKLEVKTDIDLNNMYSPAIVRTELYVNNIKVKSFGARAEIKIYEKVWVSRDWIKRGETIKNLRLEEKNVSSILHSVVKKDFNQGEYLARRNIKPGEVITYEYIEEIPTIVKDSPVSLIFKTPQVSVTIPAIAVTSGKMGDYIRVKNIQYKKNYVGRIIGDNIVLVNI